MHTDLYTKGAEASDQDLRTYLTPHCVQNEDQLEGLADEIRQAMTKLVVSLQTVTARHHLPQPDELTITTIEDPTAIEEPTRARWLKNPHEWVRYDGTAGAHLRCRPIKDMFITLEALGNFQATFLSSYYCDDNGNQHHPLLSMRWV